MSSKKNVVRVTILGDEYSIRSDVSPERTRAVAEHVDNVIKQTMRAGNIVETQKAAILAALSITDELFDAREAGEDLAGSMRRLSEEVRPWLPPAKRKE
ncbi:MAG TPA: cell division protein ZapA [Gemmatimonadaceae bacterium]|nr:cell division protein ZapA [Gemmatimonadaceae bacterium]